MSYSYFSKFYDRLVENVDYKKTASYINQIFLKYKNDTSQKILLDLGCGTGNLSFCLLDYGFDIIGIDSSYDMLNVAYSKKKSTDNVLFLNQDITDFDLYGTVDIAVCNLDTINHLHDFDELDSFFGCVSLFLHPDGLFIFDVNTKYKHEEILKNNTFVYDFDDLYVVWKNHLNEDFSVFIELDFFEKEKGCYCRYRESFTEIYISHKDIEKLCKNNGFSIVDIFSENSFNKPCFDTQRKVYILRKGN